MFYSWFSSLTKKQFCVSSSVSVEDLDQVKSNLFGGRRQPMNCKYLLATYFNLANTDGGDALWHWLPTLKLNFIHYLTVNGHLFYLNNIRWPLNLNWVFRLVSHVNENLDDQYWGEFLSKSTGTEFSGYLSVMVPWQIFVRLNSKKTNMFPEGCHSKDSIIIIHLSAICPGRQWPKN